MIFSVNKDGNRKLLDNLNPTIYGMSIKTEVRRDIETRSVFVFRSRERVTQSQISTLVRTVSLDPSDTVVSETQVLHCE